MINRLVKIPNSSLARDIRSMGLVETDTKKIDEYRAKKLLSNSINNNENLRKDVDQLKEDISSIKFMLEELIKGRK